MTRRARQFSALTSRQKGYFIEAWIRLGAGRFMLSVRSFKKLVSDLPAEQGEVESAPPGENDQVAVQAIGEAIRRAARHTPWQSACLLQALVARQMLQRRDIPGSLVIAASLEGDSGESALSAHAWVKCGDQFVTGEGEHERFTPVSTFRWTGT